ncbi:hypothetical protein E2I00_001679, partial [Balaenoptera physalus]
DGLYAPRETVAAAAARAVKATAEGSGAEPLVNRVCPMKQFWNKFLQDGAPWKNVIYKTYRHSIFAFTHVLAPVWIIHYYLKYHVNTKPYAIVERKPRIFLGDTILETGEVIPPMKEFPDQHH